MHPKMTSDIHTHTLPYTYKGTFMHVCMYPHDRLCINTPNLYSSDISQKLKVVSGFLLLKYAKTKVLSARRNCVKPINLYPDVDDHAASAIGAVTVLTKSGYYNYMLVAD